MNNLYGILDNKKVYTEIGSLKNFRFLNKYGAFNTKVLVAEWRTKSRSSIGYFEIFIPNEDKNEIQIQVSNNASNWSYYRTLNLSDNRFQEIINELTISGKPMDFKAERRKEEAERRKEEIELLRIEDFVILNSAFSRKDFSKAKDFVNTLEGGWRLPTKYELNVIYKNINKNNVIRNLMNSYQAKNNFNYFWSSSEDVNKQTAIALDFDDGSQFETKITNELNFIAIKLFKEKSKENLEKERIFEEEERKKEVIKFQEERKNLLEAERLLREKKSQDSLGRVKIENFKKNIIGQPFEYNGLIIAQFNFPNLMDLKTAVEKCKLLGPGWRLPSYRELFPILRDPKLKNVIPKFPDGDYWISDGYKMIIYNNYPNTEWMGCLECNYTFKVRAVKTKD